MTRHIGSWKDFNGAFTLAECATHVALPKGCCKNAFTLAEVLITLGIIGVVAAITMPVLIGQYQKHVAVNCLKASYNIMQNALNNAEVEHGEFRNWDFSLSEVNFLNKYIIPYYQLEETSKVLGDYICANGGDCKKYAQSNSQKYLMSNGALIKFQKLINADGTAFIIILLDINGFKNPNRLGRDVFYYSIQSDQLNAKVLPYGTGLIYGNLVREEYNRTKLMNGADSRACKKDGIYCAAVIMGDGWRIASDYPW